MTVGAVTCRLTIHTALPCGEITNERLRDGSERHVPARARTRDVEIVELRERGGGTPYLWWNDGRRSRRIAIRGGRRKGAISALESRLSFHLQILSVLFLALGRLEVVCGWRVLQPDLKANLLHTSCGRKGWTTPRTAFPHGRKSTTGCSLL